MLLVISHHFIPKEIPAKVTADSSPKICPTGSAIELIFSSPQAFIDLSADRLPIPLLVQSFLPRHDLIADRRARAHC